MTHVTPILRNSGFRFYDDNVSGAVTAQTALALANSNITRTVGQKFHAALRFSEVAGADTSMAPRLQYSLNSGAWTDVNTTSPIQAAAPTNCTTADNASYGTTALSNGLTVVATEYDSNGSDGTSRTLNNSSAEYTTCLVIDSAQVNNSDNIRLRLTNAGTAIEDIAVSEITVNKPTIASGAFNIFAFADNVLQPRAIGSGSVAVSALSTVSYAALSTATGNLSITGAATPTLVGQAFVPFSLNQSGFRFRNDDGSQSTATWMAGLNTNVTIDSSLIRFRLRFLVQETTGTAVTDGYRFQYNKNSEGWNDVTNTSSVMRFALTPNFADQDVTTQQLGAGSFVAGRMLEDATNTNTIALAGNDETEIEGCFQLRLNDVADEDTIQVRLVRDDGTALTVYSATPTITVNDRILVQESFRFRNDDGNESTATWKAALNVVPALTTDQNFRVRFAVRETQNINETIQFPILQFRVNAGAWASVAASGTAVIRNDSPNYTDKTATTQQISSGTFTPGYIFDTTSGGGLSSSLSLQNAVTEYEYCLQLNSSLLAGGDVIELRVIDSPDALDLYTNTPSITIPDIRSGTLGSTGLATPTLIGRGITAAPLSAAGLATPTLVGFTQTTASGALSSAGVSATSLVAQAITQGALASTGLATPTYLARAITASPLATGGVATVSSVGRAIGAGSCSISGLTTVSLTGQGSGESNLTSAALASVSLQSVTLGVATTTIAGAATTGFIGAAFGSGVVNVAGVGTPNLAASSTAAGDFTITGVAELLGNTFFAAEGALSAAGTSFVVFQSEEGVGELFVNDAAATVAFAGGSTDAVALTADAAQASTLLFGRQVTFGTMTSLGSTALTLEGNPVGPQLGSVSISGNSGVAFGAGALATGAYTIDGLGTTAITARAVMGAQLGAAGLTATSLVGGGLYSGLVNPAGSSLVNFISAPARFDWQGQAAGAFVGSSVITSTLTVAGQAASHIVIIPFVPTGVPEYRTLDVPIEVRVLDVAFQDRTLSIAKGAD